MRWRVEGSREDLHAYCMLPPYLCMSDPTLHLHSITVNKASRGASGSLRTQRCNLSKLEQRTIFSQANMDHSSVFSPLTL